MQKRLVSLAAVAAVGVAIAVYIPSLVGYKGPEFQFETLLQRHGGTVSAGVYDGLVIFRTELGRFTIPTRCHSGVGHISRWTLPDGRVMTSDFVRANESGWLNDPVTGALGAFAVQVAPKAPPRQGEVYTTGTKRCDERGATWASAPHVTRTTYEQSICFVGCLARLHYLWTFGPATVRLDADVRFPRGRGYVKEPELGWNVNGPTGRLARFEPLGETNCRPFVGRDPRKGTGRCADAARLGVDFADVRVRVDKSGLVRLAREARDWRPAGTDGCSIEGVVRDDPVQRSEYIGWAGGGASLLEKGWDGGINAWDCPAFFRVPGAGAFRFRATLTRTIQSQDLRRARQLHLPCPELLVADVSTAVSRTPTPNSATRRFSRGTPKLAPCPRRSSRTQAQAWHPAPTAGSS
jgi:hypothetical protein